MGFFSPEIGIDLGTNNVLFYVAGRGIVLREPSLVVVRGDAKREVSAVGEDARLMMGRMPAGYVALHPIRDGVLADFDMTEVMLRYFIRRAIGVNFIGRPKMVLSVPSEITAMERRAVEEAVQRAGGRLSYVVETAIAAALGCGLPVYEPLGSMIVDIGGGTTEVAVISMGSLVVSKSIRLSGNAMDNAIIAFVKREKNMLIGDRTGEDIKIDLGSAIAMSDPQRAMVRGRDLVTGLPQTAEIDSDQVHEALQEPLREILDAILWVLERTPPELGGDVVRTGIHLTGGGSQLPSIDQFIAAETGITVQVARNPMDCTVLGAGYLASNLDLLSRIGKNHPMTE